MAIRKLTSLLPAMLAGALAFCSLAGPALAGAPQTTATQTTDSYKIELDIGPAAVMLTPDQAATATSGEVMVDTSSMGSGGMSMGATAIPVPAMAAGTSMSGSTSMSMGSMSMSSTGTAGQTSMSGGMASMSMMQMATTDDGMPVNHHLEVHVYDKNSGAVVSDVVPSITITDNATGEMRTLSDVMGMYDIQVGMSDLHFGNNVYLQDGDPYTIQVTVGQDMTTFNNVVASDGMGLPASAMGSMGATPMSMPAQSTP